MRLPLLCTCAFLFFHALSFAQQVPSITITNEVLPKKGIYRFPGFEEGTLVFRNGLIVSQQFNYNVSLDEMHFINQQGDTLAVADPQTISFISLHGSRFYFDKGYLQVIDTAGGIALAVKQYFVIQQQRPGAYGATMPHEGARTYNYFNASGQRYTIGDNEKVSLTTREDYFLGDAYGHFSKAGKDFILAHFNKDQSAVRAFMKSHHTNFNKREDIMHLLQFCAQPGS